jgi:hypothetical protein
MRSIIIGFSTNKKWWKSALIRWGDQTKYSHVFIRFYSASLNRWLVYHAAGGDLHFVNWDKFLEKNYVIEEYRILTKDEQFIEALQYCVDNATDPYGFATLFGLGAVKLLEKIGISAKNPFANGEKTQVCHELGLRIMSITGVAQYTDRVESKGLKWLNNLIKEQLRQKPIQIEKLK